MARRFYVVVARARGIDGWAELAVSGARGFCRQCAVRGSRLWMISGSRRGNS